MVSREAHADQARALEDRMVLRRAQRSRASARREQDRLSVPPLWESSRRSDTRSLIAVAVISNQEGSLMVSFRSMNAPLVHWSR